MGLCSTNNFNHIFQEALATSNKIAHKIVYHFLTYSFPFQVVQCSLFEVLQKPLSDRLKLFSSAANALFSGF